MKSKVTKRTVIATYLAIWLAAVIVFWGLTSVTDAMGYSIVFLWGVLPVITFIISLLIGKNDYWGKWKWAFAPILGIMYMLAEYVTFSMANMLAFHKVNVPAFGMILVGAIISVVGLVIGVGIARKEK